MIEPHVMTEFFRAEEAFFLQQECNQGASARCQEAMWWRRQDMKVYVDVFNNELIVLFLVDQFTVITSIVSTLIFEIIRPYGQWNTKN